MKFADLIPARSEQQNAYGMCCFIGGGVFVAAFSHIVIGALA